MRRFVLLLFVVCLGAIAHAQEKKINVQEEINKTVVYNNKLIANHINATDTSLPYLRKAMKYQNESTAWLLSGLFCATAAGVSTACIKNNTVCIAVGCTLGGFSLVCLATSGALNYRANKYTKLYFSAADAGVRVTF